MRFGVVVGAPTRADYLAGVRRAEQLGYDVVLCSDHLELAGRHASHFTPIPALSAAATATTRIRVGTAVLNQDLRHPAVLARDAASLDVLSEGRLELGLGAGWNEPEYDMAGLVFDSVGTRVRRFAEYVQIVKGVMAQPSFSFEGEFYRIRDMPGEPAPAQRPHPPVMIGGAGPRMLALAAREADIVSINMPKAPDPGEATLAERVRWVRDATPAGEDRELQLPLAAVVPSDRGAEAAVRAAVADGGQFLLSMLARRFGVDALLDSPMLLAGSVPQMADQLARLQSVYGIGYVMIPMAQLETLAPVIAELRTSSGSRLITTDRQTGDRRC